MGAQMPHRRSLRRWRRFTLAGPTSRTDVPAEKLALIVLTPPLCSATTHCLSGRTKLKFASS